MNILQFLRIFWARQVLIMIATGATILGATVVVLLVQPRYEATSRVLLNMVVRADPVTGESMNPNSAHAFFDSQIEMVKDYRVTGRVVDQLGWLTDPGQIRAYSARPASDTRDFRRWLGQQVADSTRATVTPSGSVLEITFRGLSPQIARVGAEALRQAYLDESLAQRREAASRNATFYNQQAEAARQLAETAETAKAAFEKASGLIMQGRESDLDSERLASLAGQAALPAPAAIPSSSSAALQLAQIDAQLAEASKRLGPNHPEMQDLKTRRAMVAQVAAQEAAAE